MAPGSVAVRMETRSEPWRRRPRIAEIDVPSLFRPKRQPRIVVPPARR
jgi:hypothetical protein